MCRSPLFLTVPALMCLLSLSAWGEGILVTDSQPTYEGDVRPILKARCFICHGEGKQLKAGLDLRLRRLIVEGGCWLSSIAIIQPVHHNKTVRRFRGS